VLGVSPAANNGTEGSLYHLLVSAPRLSRPLSGSEYSRLEFPANDTQYETRRDADTGCNCTDSKVLLSGHRHILGK